MSRTREIGAGEAAFALCELEWMRTRLLVQLSCVELSAFAEQMASGAAEARPDLVGRVRDALDEVETLGEQFAARVGSLPSEGVVATREDVAVAAAATIEEGLIDAERMLHAAQWVDVRRGLAALAESLATSDAYHFWDITIERFVTAFQSADRQLARRIANEANVANLRFSELDDHQLARLAGVLSKAAEGGV